ncbi:MAG: hypothetical protein H7069_07865 [Phormidesmis sp. FL-bin-119]|nr:hypothetical protein [Pedobacter sp.]
MELTPAFTIHVRCSPSTRKSKKKDLAVTSLHKGRIMLVFPTKARINDSTGTFAAKIRILNPA